MLLRLISAGIAILPSSTTAPCPRNEDHIKAACDGINEVPDACKIAGYVLARKGDQGLQVGLVSLVKDGLCE